jgi:thermosome
MDDKPVYIMPDNTSRTVGRDAQRNNILAAKVVSDIIKTTLGPKGMDKMLVDSSGNIIVTNDGVTILEEMEIEHPAARMLVEIAKTQENEVGDGTTTAALLAGKLLENSEILLDKKIHPTVIVKGYRMASEKAFQVINDISIEVRNLSVLKNIASTAMTGKGAESDKEKLSDIIVEAMNIVSQGSKVNIDDIKIQKVRGDNVSQSELISGVVVDKEKANMDMPQSVRNANILLIDFALELKNPETETRIAISSPEQLQSFVESEEKYLKMITDKIKNSGANVVFCQKGIDDVAQYYLAKNNIFACRRVSRSDIEKISKATGAKIISNINDVSRNEFGFAEIVEEVVNSDEKLTYIRGCKNPRVVTIIARATTEHVADEIERALKDGLGDVVSAIKSGKIVAGGGAVEIEISKRLRSYAKTVGGKEQLAIEQFANSLESIPETLAENAGLDPIEIVTELRKIHESGNVNYGLNLFKGKIDDTLISGIIEPIKVKTQAINSATEVATLLLRIDDVLISKGSLEKKSTKLEDYD